MSDKLKNILAENMRRFNTKNLSEQTRNNPAAHKALELMLISKFVDLGNAGIEYKDPGMRQQFLNDYENEYSAWLNRGGAGQVGVIGPVQEGFLQQEDLNYILQEDGSKIYITV